MSAHAKAHPHEKPHHPHWPLAALLFGFVFALGLMSVHENATWIGIRTGARIIAEKAVPAADSFSYTAQGRPWTTDSWLSDVLFHLVDRWQGPGGLWALKAAAAAGGFVLLLPLNAASPLAAAGVLALGALAAWPGFSERPAVFDFLLLALLIRLLRPRRVFRWPLILQVGAVIALWANLHGTLAPLGVWLVGLKVFKAGLRTARREFMGYLALLGAALAALMLNPHGARLFSLMFDGGGTLQGAWSSASGPLSLYALFALAGAAACWVTLQQEFFLTTAAGTLLALSLVLPDLRPLYVMAVCPVIALALGHFTPALRDTPWRVARAAAALAALLAFHWIYTYAPLSRWRGYGVSSLDGALDFMQSNGMAGRLFNEIESGAAVIGRGGRPVFVDERAALYGPAFMKDAALWPARFSGLSEIYRFDYALILNRRASYPAAVLDQSPEWRLAYADDAALVYAKRRGVNAWLVSDPARGLLAPNRLFPDGLDALLSEPRRRAKVLSELDRWIVSAPGSAQALLWKGYALDRLGLAAKAERLFAEAAARPRLGADPELLACLGFARERRGQDKEAVAAYLRAAALSRRRGERPLEAAILERLAPIYRLKGETPRASALEDRARRLSAPPEP